MIHSDNILFIYMETQIYVYFTNALNIERDFGVTSGCERKFGKYIFETFVEISVKWFLFACSLF